MRISSKDWEGLIYQIALVTDVGDGGRDEIFEFAVSSTSMGIMGLLS